MAIPVEDSSILPGGPTLLQLILIKQSGGRRDWAVGLANPVPKVQPRSNLI